MKHANQLCPAAQRCIIALEEAKAEYVKCEVDPANKPEWYVPKVNPATGKIPAIIYGPQSDPTSPHPQSTKLTESLVLLEFIADLYPASGLLPPDPVRRAHIRFIIDVFMNKVFGAFYATTWSGVSPEGLYEGLEALQVQLDVHLGLGPLLGGERVSIADAVMAPFFARMHAHFRKDVGGWVPGTGPTIYAEVFESERFGTLQRYVRALLARETVKKSFPEDAYLERAKAHIEMSGGKLKI
ncbi:hypothetical protein RSOLAG22IIIB_11780 [Rhizoctonia solani]|uniref:Uncharacterized protein n=1 Tax=Rhizoctonia solani TaxID=456999 RepID=A0A0K6GA75_9AGAM|nr:hypothetical protein RSOLAG22IIIB_11780 [Rhizoctonia solani]